MNQSKFAMVYLIPCTIARKKFFAVISKTEAEKAKINTDFAMYVMGDTERDHESWAHFQDPKIKELKTFLKYQNAIRTQRKIEGTFEKAGDENATP